MNTKFAIGMAPRRATWVGYAACAWAFLFAIAHFYWALGGCAGFPAEACEAGLSNAWFLAYDLVAGVLCVLGAVIALALVRPWGRMTSRRTLLVLAWIGGAALLLRGVVGLVQDVLIVAGLGNGWYPTMLYDPWFLVGGVLFCAACWSCCPRTGSEPRRRACTSLSPPARRSPRSSRGSTPGR